MKRKYSTALVASLLTLAIFLLCNPVNAAHPLVTDDTATQGFRRQQVEFNSDRTSSGDQCSLSATATYSYGAHDDLDIYVNLPVTRSAAATGINDIGIGAKWLWFSREHVTVALKPEMLLPTGNKNNGLGTGNVGAAFTGIVSYASSKFAVRGNAGMSAYRYAIAEVRNNSRSQIWRTSVAVAYHVTPTLSLVADTGMARNPQTASSSKPAFVILGLVYMPTKDLDLDLGVRRGLQSAEAERQFGVGYTLRF